jgi:hypothetical protein
VKGVPVSPRPIPERVTMKLTVYEEELRQATTEILSDRTEHAKYVGVKIATSEFNSVTLWFESKAQADEWITNILWQLQNAGV